MHWKTVLSCWWERWVRKLLMQVILQSNDNRICFVEELIESVILKDTLPLGSSYNTNNIVVLWSYLTCCCFSIGGAPEDTSLHMLRGGAKHRLFQMDTDQPPAFFFFKRHKIEKYTQDWYSTVLPLIILSSFSDPIRENLFSCLPPREIEKERKTAIYFFLSVPLTLLFVQHFSIYLRDFLPPPTSSTETANAVTGTQSKNTPVTSHCCYRDNLNCLSSSPHCKREDQQWPWTSYHLPALTFSLPKLYWSILVACTLG